MTQAQLKAFGDALGEILSASFHYTAPENRPPKYAVWQEIAGTSVSANNRHAESGFTIDVDLFTREEYDTTIDAISNLLDSYGSWTIESVQYETDTGLIHYTWRLDYA